MEEMFRKEFDGAYFSMQLIKQQKANYQSET